MGKGDIKSKRGKIVNKSYGVRRLRKKVKNISAKKEDVFVVAEIEIEKEVKPKTASKVKATPKPKTTPKAKTPAVTKKKTAEPKTEEKTD